MRSLLHDGVPREPINLEERVLFNLGAVVRARAQPFGRVAVQ